MYIYIPVDHTGVEESANAWEKMLMTKSYIISAL